MKRCHKYRRPETCTHQFTYWSVVAAVVSVVVAAVVSGCCYASCFSCCVDLLNLFLRFPFSLTTQCKLEVVVEFLGACMWFCGLVAL